MLMGLIQQMGKLILWQREETSVFEVVGRDGWWGNRPKTGVHHSRPLLSTAHTLGSPSMMSSNPHRCEQKMGLVLLLLLFLIGCAMQPVGS